jgi:RNA polymerase sigma-70 factor (ECF subfamily)
MEIDIAHDESRSRADRERAFADRLTHAAPASYRIAALILGNHADAEDAIQEAAVEAWRHLRELRDLDRFDPWFGRIVINKCRDRTRRRRPMAVLLLDDDRRFARPPDVEDLPERDALARSLSALAPEHRTVVVLRYFADLSLQDIAERTGERLGTVKSRLRYALAALRAAYDAAERTDGSSR